MPRFTVTRRVSFSDTDMAGIVHFAQFYRYMEDAEHAFFRSLGLKIIDKQPDGSTISWPRVAAKCDFDAPAFFEDEIAIHVDIERLGNKSLTLRYEFFRGATQLAHATMTAVCCRFRPDVEMEPISIPPAIRTALSNKLAEEDRSGDSN